VRVIGLAGWSGAGKTTLIRALIPALQHAGATVSTIKQAHHAFDVDKPGKDSYLHREAGAQEVLAASGVRWALMRELRGAPSLTLPELLARLAPVDIVLVEGFKREAHPKIEVLRAANAKPPLYPDDPHIMAIATDMELPRAGVPVVGLDDVAMIAAIALREARAPEEIDWLGYRHSEGA
jgi:molybdopterin-guanine dinucleotide biosynthesis protein B